MFFIEWWMVQRIVIGVSIMLLGIAVSWYIRRRRIVWRILVRLVSLPVAALGGLLALLTITASGCQSYSEPIYSPDHLRAVRVRVSDLGATGGGTNVEVYSLHGLRSDLVFSGNWRTVDSWNVHWIGNDELQITHYDPAPGYCRDAGSIRVKCVYDDKFQPR